MTKEVSRDFFDEITPLVEERLDNIEKNYDDMMVTFVAFIANVLLEKTIQEVNSDKIEFDEFQQYMAGQLKRTLGAITDSTKIMYQKYMSELEEEGIAQRVPPDHPTVQ